MEIYKNNRFELALDEAGRGPFFGPVVAGAVVWGDAPDNELIKDSKKLSEKNRIKALEWIKNNMYAYSTGISTVEEIDKYNILEATKMAMQRAIDNLDVNDKKNIIIDGIYWEKKFSSPVESVVKGDSKFRNIAAASILAKQTRDEIIENMCLEDNTLIEFYDIKKNKGYGTKKHRDGIKTHGITKFHRKSFKILP